MTKGNDGPDSNEQAGPAGQGGGAASPGPDKDGPSADARPTDADRTSDGAVDPGTAGIELSNWVFIERVPTPQEVIDLLTNLPDVWGVKAVEFIDFVQPLPQRSKVRDANGDPVKENGRDVYRNEYRLYMSVAGREMMMHKAAETNNWRVDFTPSDYIVLDKIAPIYRETCVIWDERGESGIILGSKPGTAKFGGGDFPVEKAETAARGRAIAAWGFGVLPGSGVASLDEMQAGPAAPAESTPARQERKVESKGDLLQECLTLAEELRQIRGQDEFEMRRRLADYIRGLGLEIAVEQNEDQQITKLDWAKVSPAQLRLLREQQRKTLAEIKPSAV